MPKLHFARRVRGGYGDDDRVFLACGPSKGWGHDTTSKKDRVTCLRCMRVLGIKPPSKTPKVVLKKGRPTAWDHVLEDDDVGSTTPEPTRKPTGVQDRSDDPTLETPQPTVTPHPAAAPYLRDARERSRQELLRDRIAIIFFRLMRTYLGVEQVMEIAQWASHGSPGPGNWPDLEQRARALADLVINPPSLALPGGSRR